MPLLCVSLLLFMLPAINNVKCCWGLGIYMEICLALDIVVLKYQYLGPVFQKLDLVRKTDNILPYQWFVPVLGLNSTPI